MSSKKIRAIARAPNDARGREARYSQRKNRMASPLQTTVTPTITQTGSRTVPVPIPRNACFIIVMPCVSGKKPTIFCIAFGMTSTGSVVPEKISMGK